MARRAVDVGIVLGHSGQGISQARRQAQGIGLVMYMSGP